MRIFVAINLTDEVRRRLYAGVGDLRAADFPIRWVPPENIHLTLKFLGEVPPEDVDEVGAALREALAGAKAFDLRVAGLGAFPSRRNPRVVWAGVDGGRQLEDVHERVEGALALLGYAKEERAFHPHLTLGRVRRRSEPSRLQGLDAALERIEFEAVSPAGSVDVMKSELAPTGAEHEVVAQVDLEG